MFKNKPWPVVVVSIILLLGGIGSLYGLTTLLMGDCIGDCTKFHLRDLIPYASVALAIFLMILSKKVLSGKKWAIITTFYLSLILSIGGLFLIIMASNELIRCVFTGFNCGFYFEDSLSIAIGLLSFFFSFSVKKIINHSYYNNF